MRRPAEQPGKGIGWIAFRNAFRHLEEAGVEMCLLRDDPMRLAELREVHVLILREALSKATDVLLRLG